MSLEEMVFKGKTDGSMARGDIQFAIDGTQVRIDGTRANDQSVSNLRVGQSLYDQAQHLDLPPGQVECLGWERQQVTCCSGTPGGLRERVTGEYGARKSLQCLLHATFLAEALMPWFGRDMPEEEALANYHRRRNEHALMGYHRTVSLARDLRQLKREV